MNDYHKHNQNQCKNYKVMHILKRVRDHKAHPTTKGIRKWNIKRKPSYFLQCPALRRPLRERLNSIKDKFILEPDHPQSSYRFLPRNFSYKSSWSTSQPKFNNTPKFRIFLREAKSTSLAPTRS